MLNLKGSALFKPRQQPLNFKNGIQVVPLLCHYKKHDGRYEIRFDPSRCRGSRYAIISTCSSIAQELSPKPSIDGNTFSIAIVPGGPKQVYTQRQLHEEFNLYSDVEIDPVAFKKIASTYGNPLYDAVDIPEKSSNGFNGGYMISRLQEGQFINLTGHNVFATEEKALSAAEEMANNKPGITFIVFKAVSALTKTSVQRVDFK